MRVRIGGRDSFINRLGPWSDYQQGSFDRSLMAYQTLVEGKQVCLLEELRVKAEQKRQAAASSQ